MTKTCLQTHVSKTFFSIPLTSYHLHFFHFAVFVIMAFSLFASFFSLFL